ncbi:hypothetical protein CASFOL_014089 [Castilleja foliolosa]|uniref:Defective in cullin neddylation protein n=1 Tax=Castilleja foliolosa TaxID=1961234 RepID=A0ABD3DN09_9LAMI
MTRPSKRKSDLESSAPAKTARSDSVRSAVTKGYQRIDGLYNKYADKSSGIIDANMVPEGIEKLCSDIKVEYTDVRILMLACLHIFMCFKEIECSKAGIFYSGMDEWRRGLKALKVDTMNKLKKALPELEKEVFKTENFEDFYKYAFNYCLTEEKQKCLDIESTCVLIDLVLGCQYQPQVASFLKFLKFQSEYKVMNMDQWTSFLRFCQEISFPDLQNYDTCLAWPLLLDNFVDWLKENANVTSD